MSERDYKAEARRTKKALRELSDWVLLYLDWMDKRIGPDKTIPREVSKRLGAACTGLDMQNDAARRHHLGLSITADGKRKAADELRGLFVPAALTTWATPKEPTP